MNDMDAFQEKATELLILLGPPVGGFNHHDSKDEEFAELNAALGFPNPTQEERSSILAAHWARQAVNLGRGTLRNAPET